MKQFSATIAELAELIGGTVEGNANAIITGVAVVEDAEEGDIVIADKNPYFDRAMDSAAYCILTGMNCGSAAKGKSLLRSQDPQEAFVRLLKMFGGEEVVTEPGVAVGAVLEDGVQLGEKVTIGANSYIGKGASLGNGAVIYPNVYIGDYVTIGANCRIYPNVSIYKNCTIGNRVILHSGVVVGGDGFGFKSCGDQGLMKYPHVGTVEINDDVEIGANSTIDRAKTGKTVIGSGTKIDNLVHIAHNVKVGSNCVIVALVGVAGSCRIGDGVTLAAQSGVKDHVNIGDHTVVAARAGVTNDIPDKMVVSGFPAREHRQDMRAEAARIRLPEMMKRLRAIEKEIEILKESGIIGQEDILP